MCSEYNVKVTELGFADEREVSETPSATSCFECEFTTTSYELPTRIYQRVLTQVITIHVGNCLYNVTMGYQPGSQMTVL